MILGRYLLYILLVFNTGYIRITFCVSVCFIVDLLHVNIYCVLLLKP